jgi:hypothetical protein
MTDDFYRDVEETRPGWTMIVRGDGHGRVALKAGDGKLLVVLTGEPTGEDLLGCFRAALEQNVLLTEMPTLVDSTQYFGLMDWKSVFSIRHLAPWGEGGTDNARTAYLFRDTDSDATMKIVTAMFTKSLHRAFTDRDAAIQWLETRGP